MNYKLVAYGALLFFITQILIWYQGNGQFVYKWFRENTLILTLLGIPTSFFMIVATRYTVEGLGGVLWPMRFIAFSTGIFIFTILTWYHMDEPINLKTGVSLLLATAIVLIQLFWKS